MTIVDRLGIMVDDHRRVARTVVVLGHLVHVHSELVAPGPLHHRHLPVLLVVDDNGDHAFELGRCVDRAGGAVAVVASAASSMVLRIVSLIRVIGTC